MNESMSAAPSAVRHTDVDSPAQKERPSGDRLNSGGDRLNSERRLGAILADVLQNTDNLVRQEFELAIAKLETKVETVKSDLVVSAIGGAVLYAGILALVAACVLGLATVMVPWGAALVVGLLVSGIGFLTLQRGTSRDRDVAASASARKGIERRNPLMGDKLQEISK